MTEFVIEADSCVGVTNTDGIYCGGVTKTDGNSCGGVTKTDGTSCGGVTKTDGKLIGVCLTTGFGASCLTAGISAVYNPCNSFSLVVYIILEASISAFL